IKGPDGGYRLAPGAGLPPLMFDDEQAIAIAIALQSIPSSGVDIDEGAQRALATVRQVMPSRLRHRIDGIRFTDTARRERVDPAALEAVSAAVRDRQTLRFGYGERDVPLRRTHPHAIVARGGRWYLIAWDLDEDDWRIFRLDRMSPRHPAGPGFLPRALPATDAQTYLAARSKGSDAEDRWPCVGQIDLALPARDAAPWIADGELEPLTDQSCRITIGSWSWVGVLAFVTRFDVPFTIVGPPELAEASEMLAVRFRQAT
uniref:helix-turn-helix transcriptional regulator n=1 Tax=Microbacterium sp. TaxID=51671 RepID=UPI002606444F